MDISGAQLNSAVLDGMAAQPQPAVQGNRPPPPPPPQPASAEVMLSRDARDRASQPPPPPQSAPPQAPNESRNPVQAAGEAPTAQEDRAESRAVQAGETASREQQSNPVVQAQANAPTYTARIAAQSYTSVSNF